MLRNNVIEYILDTFDEIEVVPEIWLKHVQPTLENFVPCTKVVLLDIKDHFIYDNLSYPFNPVSTTLRCVHTLAKKYPTVLFIVLQENYFVEKELQHLEHITNLRILTVADFLFNEYNSYCGIEPVYQKNNSNKPIICLNNNPRPHRVGIVLMLLHSNLGSKSNISFLSNERKQKQSNYIYTHETILSWAEWNDPIKNDLRNIADNNFYNYQFLTEDVYVTCNKNSENFKNKLQNHYVNSYIEFVSETLCIEPTYQVNEKFLNSVFGCNFPILVSSKGSVQVLRDMGFDMFDDIINHSYDDIDNPFYRIKASIDLNSDLLQNTKKIKEVWHLNLHRFKNNVQHYKTKVYDIEFQRLINEIVLLIK